MRRKILPSEPLWQAITIALGESSARAQHQLDPMICWGCVTHAAVDTRYWYVRGLAMRQLLGGHGRRSRAM